MMPLAKPSADTRSSSGVSTPDEPIVGSGRHPRHLSKDRQFFMLMVVNVRPGNGHRVFLGLCFAELMGAVNGRARTIEEHPPLVEFGNHQKGEVVILGLKPGHRSKHNRLHQPNVLGECMDWLPAYHPAIPA